MADHGGREVNHATRDATVCKESTRQNKKRDRHDLEFLDAGEQFQCHCLHRHLGHGEQEGQYRKAERDRDRHPGQHQRNQQNKDQRCIHWRPSAASLAKPSTWE